MTEVTGFAPIEGKSARVLILGSMPGIASLDANEYYAHPQNAFWRIMEALLGTPATAGYHLRVEALKQANIALWDVLKSCTRPGSMDAAINIASAKINDIPALLVRQPEIHTICFNGSTAERIFKKRIQPSLNGMHLRYIKLPSTSPAHASMSFNSKVMAWRSALQVPNHELK